MGIGMCREVEGMMGCSDGTPAWNTYQKDGCAHQLWLVGKEGWGGPCRRQGGAGKAGLI